MPVKPFNIVTRRFPVFQAYANMIGNKYEGYTYFDVLPEGRSGISAWIDLNDLKKEGAQIMSKYRKDPTYLTVLARNNLKAANRLVSYSKEISKEDLSLKTDYGLRQRFTEFVNCDIDAARYMVLPHSLQPILSGLILDWAKKKFKNTKKAQEFLTRVAVPQKEAESEKAHEEFLKIASEIAEDSDFVEILTEQARLPKIAVPIKIKRMIKHYIESYAWVPMVSMANKPYDEERIFGELKSLFAGGADPKQQFVKLKARKKQQVEDARIVLSEVGVPKGILDYVKALQDYIFLRTYRMDAFGKAFYYTRNLFEEMAHRAGVTAEGIKYASHLELTEFLDTGLLSCKSQIPERMRVFAFSMRNNVVGQILVGLKAKEHKKNVVERRI